MYLTRIYLNPHRRGAKQLMSSRQILHAAVMNCFPPGVLDDPGAPRVLWRLDYPPSLRSGLSRQGSPSCALFISSPVPPDPSHIVAAQVNERGQKKILAHVTQAQQIQWVLKKAKERGFRVLTSAEIGGDLPVLENDNGERVDGANLLINGVEHSIAEFKRDGHRVTLAVATFEGVLEVTDPVALRHALVNGIGRGKAYGCGLMTLARP